jgi:tape measure domain-containing protein
MSEIGSYYAQIGVRGMASVQGAFGKVKSGLHSLASGAVSPIKKLGGSVMSLANPLTLVGAAATVAGAYGVKSFLSLASETEALATQFRVLLGSGEAAKAMMDDINKFAASTPFEQMELAQTAKQLLATGSAAGGVVGEMRRLGDMAALTGSSLGDLAAIYGKVRGQGKLTGETLEQLTDRAIPIVGQLAKQFGKSEAEIRKMVSAGKIGFAEVQQAIAGMTDEGGRFAGGMEALAETTGGLWSTVTGNFKTLASQIGTAIIDIFGIKDGLKGLGEWLGSAASNFQENFGPAIAWMRETVGAVIGFIGDGFSALTDWLKAMWAQWGEAIMAFAATVKAYLTMIYEICVAVFTTVWEFFSSALSGMRETLASWFGFSADGLADMVTNWLHSIEFVLLNWKLFVQISWERFKLFISNIPAYFKAAIQNMVNLVKWFAENWREILYTSVDWVLTVFTNLGKNIRAIWQGVLDFFAGEGFSVDWTPLTEGFHNSIKSMPEMVSAEVRASTPELDRLYKELGKRREEFYAKKRAKGETVAAEAAKGQALPNAPNSPTAGPAAASKAKSKKGFSFTGIAQLANAMQTEAGKREEEAAKAAMKTADATGKLADAADGGALKVKVVAAPAATYS